MSDGKELDATIGFVVVKTPFVLDDFEFDDEPCLFPPDVLENASFSPYLISLTSS